MTSRTTRPSTITADDLRARLDRDPATETSAPRILDVRSPAEYETAHIPGSYNVPLPTLAEHRHELARHLGHRAETGEQTSPVVLVCRSGARATQAETALAATGRNDLRVLDGGMVAWEQAGGPVNRGRQTWDIERQVRLVAGGIVATSVLGSHFAPHLKWVAAALGAGLVTAALTNSCAMGSALSRMPWNQTRHKRNPDLDDVLTRLAD